MNGFITTILIISGVILLIAAVLTTFRLLDGPSSLDRLVALDTIIAVSMCGLAVWAAYSKDTTIVSRDRRAGAGPASSVRCPSRASG